MSKSTTAWPVQKVAATGISGAVLTLMLWGANKADLDIPPDVAAAMVTVGCFAAGYLVPPKRGETR